MLLEDMINHAVALYHAGKLDQSLDVIYNNMDEMLLDGKFDEINEFLESFDVTKCSTGILLAVCINSGLPIKHNDHDMPNFKPFCNRLAKELFNRGHDEKIMAGIPYTL